MQTTQNDVHAHDVIDLIQNASPALSLDGVVAEVNRRYGPAVRFHTCSASGMTIQEVLEFLATRRKIVLEDGRLLVNSANVCKH